MYIFLGFYTLFLVMVWGLFVVAKIHSYKFKHFSEHIEIVTKALLVFLILFSILGYAIIIYIFNWGNGGTINFGKSDFYFNEVNY